MEAASLCDHRNNLTTNIDVVCADCGLVLKTHPWKSEDFADRLILDDASSRRLKTEIKEVCRCLGINATQSLVNSLSSSNPRQGNLRYVALARVYSHFRGDIPLDYVLNVLDVSLHDATRALKAEGVYSDEPADTIVGFAVRRSGALPEAYQECLESLHQFPTMSRRVVVAAVIADWVGVEVCAEALAMSIACVRRAVSTLNEHRNKKNKSC